MTMNGRFIVFQDLTFDVPEGSNVGLIGRNGAGKSTLIRLLSAVEPPDSGKIITRGRLSWPVGLRTGMQNNLTGRENVKFVCRLQGIRGSDMKEIVEYVRDFADIGEYFDRPVSNYSSGMRARIAFGTSMAFDFDYYLIDEAMAVGDAVFKRKSRAVFKERLQKSKVVLVSHNMKLIRRMCNVVVHLDQGRATVYENVNEGIAQYRQAGGEP
jgi:capsular polysaccharide transport system ATP-binding protein